MMLRLNNNLPLLTSTMLITKGVTVSVIKNSMLVSNTLKNSTNKFILLGNKKNNNNNNNNNILTLLKNQYQYQNRNQTFFNSKMKTFSSSKKSSSSSSIFKLSSSLMNFHNSFLRNSFSTLQSSKFFLKFNNTNNSSLNFKKSSSYFNNSISISSLTKYFSSKITSKETTNTTITSSVNEGKSMTEKFKILTKKYGISAVAVYFAISALDLGLTFILVQIGGADRVKKVEDWFKKTFGDWTILRKVSTPPEAEKDTDKYGDVNGNKSNKTPSLASTLVIAYGIHKLLVPFRLGLTAAVTPAIVKKLKRMGWNIGGKHL